jgi:hypothetical protein
MGRSTDPRAAVSLVLGAVIALEGCLAREPVNLQHYQKADFEAQVATCMRIIAWSYTLQGERNKPGVRLPRSLEEFAVELGGGYQPRAFLDGWGRRLIYYATSDGHWVIASFGRNGRAEGQTLGPGELTMDPDYDADIVMIDGDWAQRPRSIGGLS